MTVDRVLTGGLAVASVVVGMLLAIVGAFLAPSGAGAFSVGDVFALLTTGPYCHLVGRAGRSVALGVVPAIAWLTTSMLLAAERPEGDVVITLQPKPIAFLLLGTVSAAVGIGTIRSRLVRPNGSSDGENGR